MSSRLQVVDANLLIYAVNSSTPYHRAARAWWQDALSGTEQIRLPWIVILAFLRITTHPRIFTQPLVPHEASAYVDSWLRQPFVEPLAASAQHWPILRDLLAKSGTAGNLTADAHIAAMAIEQNGVVISADSDFKRYAGVEHINPL